MRLGFEVDFSPHERPRVHEYASGLRRHAVHPGLICTGFGTVAVRALYDLGMSDGWDVASTVAAVVSALGGGIAYWRSTVSGKARDEAREERERAERAVTAAERHAAHAGQVVEHLEGLRQEAGSQSENMGKIAASIEGPPFTIEFRVNSQYRLTNHTGADVRIERIVNRDEFVRPDRLPKDGTELEDGVGVDFLIVGANQRQAASALVLELVGEDFPVKVPIPVKPRT